MTAYQYRCIRHCRRIVDQQTRGTDIIFCSAHDAGSRTGMPGVCALTGLTDARDQEAGRSEDVNIGESTG
ncbi:hypothetical protein MCAG_02808 [Micromonospora sp. ATCC 39149]|nr:hypothetical protein MCAG_02808 [Micromonospora sp. ATCC 39149]